jgi:hypothetical protein
MVPARAKPGGVGEMGWLPERALPVGHPTRSRDRVGTPGVPREVTPVETGTAAERAWPGLRASGREAGSNRDRCRGTFVHEVQNGTIKHGSVRNDGLAAEGRDLKRRCK